MSLLFDNSAEQVAHSAPQLTDPFTVVSWVRPTNVDANLRHLGGQEQSSGRIRFLTSDSSGAGRLRLTVNNSGLLLDYVSVDSVLSVNAWQFIGYVCDIASAQDGKIYHGDLSTLVTEVSYAVETDAGGTFNATSGDMIFGRDSNASLPFLGDIAIVMVWPGTALTLGQIQAQQFRPHITPGCEIFSHYGYNGVGAQPDWSGNGNSGTVTGATVSDHVPLGPPFGFSAKAANGILVPAMAKLILPAFWLRQGEGNRRGFLKNTALTILGMG